MRYIPKPQTAVSKPEPEPGMVQKFDIEELLAKGGEILRREITNLLIESSTKKLSPASARDAVSYVKLLSELKAAQDKELNNLTEEELLELTKE